MDFKWTLSRPGIALEFETGSIKEAIGLLESEGTQISEIFGLTMGAPAAPAAVAAASEPVETDAQRKKREKKEAASASPAVAAVAPPPLPVPGATTLPPNSFDDGIPPGLKRDPVTNTAPVTASPPPLLPSPPIAPTPPPVGVLGPKVVAALDLLREGKPDGGQALSDWLHSCGLTQKGATYDDACRVVLMTSDAKLTETGIPVALKVAAA